MHQQNDGQRWRELDGIRGIAACLVVIYHFYLLIADTVPSWMRWTLELSPLYLFISGLESMLTFFLISGFVLSLPYHRRPDRLDYPGFLIRRVARIYLPYLAGLFLAILGNAFFHGLKVNDWFAQTWAGPVKLETALQHIFFIGNYNYSAFNGAFWTLVFEMRISLIFPLLCLLVIRIGWVKSLILALGLILLALVLGKAGVPLQTTYTFRIASIFIVGILLSRFLVFKRESLTRLSPLVRHSILATSFVVYIYAHLIPSAAAEGIAVIGACGLIFSALAEPAFSRILRLPAFQFLGQISYSIYLLHITILYVLVYLFYQRVPLGWLFIPFVLCVLAASVGFYYLVINPSIQLGHLLSKRFRPGATTSEPVSAGGDPVKNPPPAENLLIATNQEGQPSS